MSFSPSPAPTIAAVETATISLRPSSDLVVHGSSGSHDRSDFALVRVTTDAGVQGYGEVSATAAWSGEDAVTAVHLIKSVLAPELVGRELVPVAALSAIMDREMAANPFTKCGLNMALWDALGHTTGRSVAELLGGPFADAIPMKMSLSGDRGHLDGAFAAARARGVRAFKVKVGFDVEGDVARFARARELAGPDAFLGADANGGWTRSAAARAIPQLRELGAAFIEQPVAAADLDGLRLLRAAGLPVVADESIFSLGDVVRLVRADAADVASVYVGKSSALERAVRAIQTLDLFGVESIVGSNGELGIGAAAQIHVACACERLAQIPSDIIGELYYDESVLERGPEIDGTLAHLPPGPGLGVQPTAEIVGSLS